MLIFRRIHCIHAAYSTVTFYESSWWPVGVYMQHMVLSLSTRVRGGLSVHSVHRQATTNRLQSDSTVCCMYIHVYPPEDEHLRLETCRGI